MRSQIVIHLIKNQLLDLRKNAAIFSIAIIAPFLAFIMNLLDQASPTLLAPMWVNYAVVLVGVMLPGVLIAEEKEKGVLDSLLVSPARYNEIILSKILVALLVIFIDVLLILGLNVGFIGNQWIIWAGVLLSSTLFIQIGLIIGLFADSQVDASTTCTPVMLFFLLIPMFSSVLPDFIRWAIDYVPSLALMDIVKTGLEVGSVSKSMTDLLVLIIWNGLAVYFTKLGIKHQFSGN